MLLCPWDFPARILEWVAISFYRASSQARDWSPCLLLARRILWEALGVGLVAKSCPTLCEPMDCSLPGSSVHGLLQARILERVAISFSRGSSQPRDQIRDPCIAGRFLTNWAMREWEALILQKRFIIKSCLPICSSNPRQPIFILSYLVSCLNI